MTTMKRLATLYMLVLLISLSVIVPQRVYAGGAESEHEIREWKMQWIGADEPEGRPPANLPDEWTDGGLGLTPTIVPEGKKGIWIRFHAPTVEWKQPGLLIQRMYGQDVALYEGRVLIYRSERNFNFDLNKMITRLSTHSDDSVYYLRIASRSDRVGLISEIKLGDYDSLSDQFVRRDLPDLLLGTGIAFLAMIMLICSKYLTTSQRRPWISLCLVALSVGLLIANNCPLSMIYYKDYAKFLLIVFDTALFVLFPALAYYFDEVFERKYPLFTGFRKVQLIYNGFCLLLLLINEGCGNPFYSLYYLVSVIIMGLFIVFQLLIMSIYSILHAARGNRDSLFLSIGIGALALTGIADLSLFYVRQTSYELHLWKYGMMVMIIALVIILARRITLDHLKLVSYSKELELYNHKLQRSEKLKVISQLAASVAHEVRNPLQVTRGFLQLLSGKAEAKNAEYFGMAINELDRASSIITDFLTFAKPEMDEMMVLHMVEEMRQIEAMMTPLANMQGGSLQFRVSEEARLFGNSSKFKQAFIHLIKNSIEAFEEEGLVIIQADVEGDETVIRIADNGRGMEEEEIEMLGGPYFSMKSKGTGLGLMVTFRIIEVMKGTIEIRSWKGKGTEAVIRFPKPSQFHETSQFQEPSPEGIRT